MVNGVLTAELFMPGTSSLKEKRHRLKSLRERLRLRFNVAVAEVGHQDSWQRATLAVAAVAGKAAQVHRVFQEVVDFIDGYRDTVLSDYQVDLYGVYLGNEKGFEVKKVDSGGMILITGGVRSGKSAFAESLLRGAPRVVYAATAIATDEEMTARIAAHKARRPSTWDTVEEPVDLVGVARTAPTTVPLLIDCLGVWVSNLLDKEIPETEINKRVDEFLEAVVERQETTIAVTNEVGMGIVPSYPLGRIYRDILGRINQRVAMAADSVYLLICGIPVLVKP
ncbi:MAG: bifunctional adenosylcobinamide kinase/adenosylcobinamide-phosphate guanylyltransferase [Bacillota bacterium]